MGDNFLVSGLIVKYVSVNYIKTFQFKMFYHVISTVKDALQVHSGDHPSFSEFRGPGPSQPGVFEPE